jgi:hypothetical protein
MEDSRSLRFATAMDPSSWCWGRIALVAGASTAFGHSKGRAWRRWQADDAAGRQAPTIISVRDVGLNN